MRKHLLVWFGSFAVLLAAVEQTVAQGFKFLEVKVVDSDGQPLADVPVEINMAETIFPMPTNAEGKVAVNVPTAENGEVEVRVKHEGYAAMAVGWRGGKVPEQVTIPLAKGVSFGGIVHDETGEPIKGVTVSGEMVLENRHGLVHDGKVAPYLDGELATTDEHGRWKCSFVPEGNVKFELNFSHPDYVALLAKYESSDWDELKEQRATVVLEKGIMVTGNVLGPDGSPLTGAFVEIVSQTDKRRRGAQVVSDGEGRFRSPPLPIGKATISVNALELAPFLREFEVLSSSKPLTLRLREGRPIRLHVVNEFNEPITGARMWMSDWLYRSINGGGMQETDNKGIWEWAHAPEKEQMFVIEKPGFMYAEVSLAPGDHTIILEPEVKITGKVIDKETRKPIEEFQLKQLLWIDCGQSEGEECLEVFVAPKFQTTTGYVFGSGVKCKQFKLLCKADGYKEAGSRIMHTDERTITFDFELEWEDDTQ